MSEEKGKSSAVEKTESSKPKKRTGDHLKKYRWPKGKSGNPGGRPKVEPITEALVRLMLKKVPKAKLREMHARYGLVHADLIARRVFAEIMQGDGDRMLRAFDKVQKIVDHVEQKGPAITVGEGGVVTLADESAYGQTRELAERLRDRATKRRNPDTAE